MSVWSEDMISWWGVLTRQGGISRYIKDSSKNNASILQSNKFPSSFNNSYGDRFHHGRYYDNRCYRLLVLPQTLRIVPLGRKRSPKIPKSESFFRPNQSLICLGAYRTLSNPSTNWSASKTSHHSHWTKCPLLLRRESYQRYLLPQYSVPKRWCIYSGSRQSR